MMKMNYNKLTVEELKKHLREIKTILNHNKKTPTKIFNTTLKKSVVYQVVKQYAKNPIEEKILFNCYNKIHSLSHVSKLDNVFCFDTPLSTCQNRCLLFLYNICYFKNNQQTHINPDRIAILEHNLKLLQSDQFVKTLTYELKLSNQDKFRFFSGGSVENYKQLKKIFKVCNNLKNMRFAMFINRDDIITELFEDAKTHQPKNLNIILSSPQIDQSIPKFLKNHYDQKLVLTYCKITTNKKEATCNGSKSGFCDTCEDCYLKPKDQRNTQQAKEIVLFQHGSGIDKKTTKLKNCVKSLLQGKKPDFKLKNDPDFKLTKDMIKQLKTTLTE